MVDQNLFIFFLFFFILELKTGFMFIIRYIFSKWNQKMVTSKSDKDAAIETALVNSLLDNIHCLVRKTKPSASWYEKPSTKRSPSAAGYQTKQHTKRYLVWH